MWWHAPIACLQKNQFYAIHKIYTLKPKPETGFSFAKSIMHCLSFIFYSRFLSFATENDATQKTV